MRKLILSFLLALAFPVLLQAGKLELCKKIGSGFSAYSLEQAQSEGASLQRLESALNIKKKKIDSAEILILPGVYPPYSYGINLLNKAMPFIKDAQKILVLGTGAGYEAVILAKAFQSSLIHATDINNRAVANTELNAEFYKKEKRILSWESDLFNQVKDSYDIILFNAPRPVSKADLDGRNAKRLANTNYFDLSGSLLGRLMIELPKHLKKDGKLFLMTDLESHIPQKYKKTQLFKEEWVSENPGEGFYQILMIETQ